MGYIRYLVDASALDEEARCKVWEFLVEHTDIHKPVIPRPGVYDAFFHEADISALKNPIFSGCEITDITQIGI